MHDEGEEEVKRTVKGLVATYGAGAHAHAQSMIASMRRSGDGEIIEFWRRVAKALASAPKS